MAPLHMLYNDDIELVLHDIAKKLQHVRDDLQQRMMESPELPLYPLPEIEVQQGQQAAKRSSLQVSTIVESSLVGLARDIKRAVKAETPFTLPDMPTYVAAYLRYRKYKRDDKTVHANSMLISLSEAGLDAIETIGKHLESTRLVEGKLLYPPQTGELNRKLIIMIALLYAKEEPAP